MDATVQALLTTQATTFKGDALGVFVAIIPLAIGLGITIALFFWGWRIFMGFFHRGGH